jgi:hypothetical protein
MKRPLLIVLAVFVLATVSTLTALNNACKSSRHAWCAPIAHHSLSLRHARAA